MLTADWKAAPIWWDDAPLTPADAPVPASTDAAIIGSGYCGLMAALTLARAGVPVVVLEAGDPGFGASTRNHGHIGGGGKLPPKLDTLVGPERAQLIREDMVDATDFLHTLIRTEQLDVDLVQRGRFIAAHSRPAFAGLQRRAETLRSGLRLTVNEVPERDQRQEIGSDFYYGGIVVEEAAALHPAKLYRGLRKLAEAAGVVLCGRARVTGIDGAAGRYRLQTARGTIEASTVIAATNAYTGPEMPQLRRRVIPVSATLVATEPLPADVADSVLPRNRTGGDTKRALYAFRRSPDGRRVIFAGRAKFREIDERQSSRILHRFMTEVWPQLAPHRISHGWKGFVGFTFDFLPHMGTQDGIHYAAGCQGSGVTLMTYLGHQMALKVLGRQNRPCGFDGVRFPQMPGYDGRPWFVPAIGRYYRLRDALDRALSARAAAVDNDPIRVSSSAK